MNKELFKEFVAFCEKQPEDKVINHRTWASCAVGDYARSLGADVPTYSQCRLDTHNCPVHNLIGIDPGLELILGNPSAMGVPNTYGEFTEFLKSYL